MSAANKSVNKLMEGLPSRIRNRILEHCELVAMTSGDVLCEPGRPFRHVYFPLSGCILLVATMDSDQSLEMGLIGNEGMLGATLALGVNDARLRGVVQGTGSALRMSAAQFRVGSSRVDLQACKLEYSIVSPK